MDKKLMEIFEKKKVIVESLGKERKNAGNINGERTGMKNSMRKRYDAVSKNGDTLELSEAGKVMEKGSGKIADSTLLGYSEAKLKQLYIQKAITKQQYDKAMEKKK